MAGATLTLLILLAGTMAGEADVLGEPAMLAVGHVALNRLASPDFPNDLRTVLHQGFRGFREPTEWHVALARRVLSEPDTTDGCLFALSRQDMEMLAFPRGDLEFGQDFFRLYCYRNWHEPEERIRKEEEW